MGSQGRHLCHLLKSEPRSPVRPSPPPRWPPPVRMEHVAATALASEAYSLVTVLRLRPLPPLRISKCGREG